MHHLAGLAEGVGVHVLHAPGQGGGRSVVLAVDDVADAADCEPDHRRRPARVDQLQIGDAGAARPDVGAEPGAEEAAPLADAAFGDEEDMDELPGEKLEVLPDIEDARADQPQDHHPGHAVRTVRDVDLVLAQQPQTEARRGEDAEDGENAVPRDEERAEPEQVRLQVDHDRQEHHDSAALRRRVTAISFGSSARV